MVKETGPQISDLYIYPIKSFRGLRLTQMDLDLDGPRWDRQWMLVDEKGSFLTIRQIPELVQIGVRILDGASIELSKADAGEMDFGMEEREGDEFQVRVWKSEVPAFEVSGEVSKWLSDVLSKKVRLVRLSESAARSFNEERFPGRHIRFVDSQPLQVISRASLEQLETILGAKMSMSRFRPSIVVDGVAAHAEDTWPAFFSGGVQFEAMKPCTRCKITTTHPLTGEVGEEPLKTLATYRKSEDGKICFGYMYAHCSEGVLKVGAPVEIG